MQLSWGFYKDENERESAENPAWHPLIDLQMPESEGTWEGLLPIPGGGWPSQHHALCVRAKSRSRVRCWFFVFAVHWTWVQALHSGLTGAL